MLNYDGVCCRGFNWIPVSGGNPCWALLCILVLVRHPYRRHPHVWWWCPLSEAIGEMGSDHPI